MNKKQAVVKICRKAVKLITVRVQYTDNKVTATMMMMMMMMMMNSALATHHVRCRLNRRVAGGQKTN